MSRNVPIITANSLTITKCLTTRPVFFGKVNGVEIVIKGDAKGTGPRTDSDTEASIKWSSKLMKNVNNSLVNTKIMTPQEISIFVQAALPVVGPANKNITPPGVNAFTWVKMPMVQGLSDADVWEKTPQGYTVDRIKLKKVVGRLLDETVWLHLGKVLATDIFTGNSDRFDIKDGHWVNNANLMFIDGGSVVGLDTFDPNSPASNLALAGAFDTQVLRTLIDPTLQLPYARSVAASIGEELSKAARKAALSEFSYKVDGGPDGPVSWKCTVDELKTLFVPNAQLLAAGLNKGSNDLKTYLQNKVRLYRARAPGPSPATVARPLPTPPGAAKPPSRPPPVPTSDMVQRASPVPGIPRGIIDRMVALGWMI